MTYLLLAVATALIATANASDTLTNGSIVYLRHHSVGKWLHCDKSKCVVGADCPRHESLRIATSGVCWGERFTIYNGRNSGEINNGDMVWIKHNNNEFLRCDTGNCNAGGRCPNDENKRKLTSGGCWGERFIIYNGQNSGPIKHGNMVWLKHAKNDFLRCSTSKCEVGAGCPNDVTKRKQTSGGCTGERFNIYMNTNKKAAIDEKTGCAYTEQLHYRGPAGNENVRKIEHVPDVSACITQCSRDPECEYWVFKNGHRCWLKKNFKSIQYEEDNHISGFRCDKGHNWNDVCAPNYDGYDVPLKGCTSISTCQKACQADPDCDAFAYHAASKGFFPKGGWTPENALGFLTDHVACYDFRWRMTLDLEVDFEYEKGECARVEISSLDGDGKRVPIRDESAAGELKTEVLSCDGAGTTEGAQTITTGGEQTKEDSYSFDKSWAESFELSTSEEVTTSFTVGYEVGGGDYVPVSTSLEMTNEVTLGVQQTSGSEFSTSEGTSHSRSRTVDLTSGSNSSVSVEPGEAAKLVQRFKKITYETKFTAEAICYDENDKEIKRVPDVTGTYTGTAILMENEIKNVKIPCPEVCEDHPVRNEINGVWEAWYAERAGWDCDWFGRNPTDRCSRKGNVTYGGMTAQDACCACGGGTGTPTVVVDLVEAGYTCQAYDKSLITPDGKKLKWSQSMHQAPAWETSRDEWRYYFNAPTGDCKKVCVDTPGCKYYRTVGPYNNKQRCDVYPESACGCESGWTAFNGDCYQRQTETLKYEQARANCAAKGASISVPNTSAENDFLAGTMNPDGVAYTWIGFDYDNSEQWEDGSASSATNGWRILYEVDDSADRTNGQPVVFMRPSGAWSFEPKYYRYQSVCEKKKCAKFDPSFYGVDFLCHDVGAWDATQADSYCYSEDTCLIFCCKQ